MAVITTKMPSRLVAALAALGVALALAGNPVSAACLCALSPDTACAMGPEKPAQDTPEPSMCGCCETAETQTSAPEPIASTGTRVHRCDCAATAPHPASGVLASAAVHTPLKPILSPEPSPLAAFQQLAQNLPNGRGPLRAPVAVDSAPPPYLLVCSLLI